MSEAVVAKRYADALFQLASEKNNVENIQNALSTVKDVIQNTKEVVDFLNHPRIKQADKMNIVEEAFGKFDKDVVNLIKLLVERHRISLVPAVIDHFAHFYNEENGIADATVYSVRALTDAEKEHLESSFTTKLNKKSVSINNVVDPSLIGGMKIRVGNTIYDGSISNKLNRLKQNIVSASK